MGNISEHVKREREARGITLEELAKGTFISVAVLKDIESGAFDKYKGDELYLKMYLRKIAKYLGLEEKELDAEFEALTQEIYLDEVRNSGKKNKRTAEENKKNVTISEKMSDTFKDLKNVKPKKQISNKRVYEDRYLMRYFKYALVVLVCVAIIFVVWYSIVASRSSSDSGDFKDNNTPTVEGSNQTGKQDTDDNKDDKKEDDTKKDDEKDQKIEVIKNGTLDYSFKLPEGQDKFQFKVEFVGRTWCQLKVNGTEYEGFKSGIYNDANKSNSLDATPETVVLEFNKADFQNLELRFGYFMGHRFYINDTLFEVDPSEYSGGGKTLKITRVE